MPPSEVPNLSVDEAAAYEEFFVPTLFAQWAPIMADAARLQPGDHVLDVACGTGILARTAAERVGSAAAVVGLDPMEGMLTVAARKAPEIEWRQGVAESLPFPDEHFHAVVSQFGLMFFRDPPGAIREMMRVLRPAGGLAVAVWDATERIPAYAAFIDLLRDLFGSSVGEKLEAPFALGDPQRLLSIFADAGVLSPTLMTRQGTGRFSSIRAWVHADAAAWLQLDDRQSRTLLEAAESSLKSFQSPEGTVVFPMPAHIVTAVKP